MAEQNGAHRRFWCAAALGAALLAAVLALAGCGGAAAPKASVDRSSTAGRPSPAPTWDGVTQQRQFAPYDASGTLTVHATTGGSGGCFATSISVPLAGVYRCLEGNSILDPCFAPAKDTSPPTVACFDSPWSGARVITVTGDFPKYLPVLMAGNPWGIQLQNGVRCVSVTGAVPAYNGVNLTYQCDGQNMAGIDTDANGNITAHYGPLDGPLIDVGVVTAWRGRSFRLSG
ncbi:MAG: hypothetical protein EPN43_14285 [Jatrophihabitans sp.]|nr:MAG: hypothetical protein EPN43_14285 [Jatrophihabitans sp.]